MKSGGGGSAAGVGETAFAKREYGCENRCETVAEGEEAATAIQAAIRGRQQRKEAKAKKEGGREGKKSVKIADRSSAVVESEEGGQHLQHLNVSEDALSGKDVDFLLKNDGLCLKSDDFSIEK